MRKIFVSVIIIAAVLGVMGAGVLAQWTGKATIPGNRIEAGSVEIELTQDGGCPIPLNLEGICPCDWFYYTFVITNVSECTGPVWLHLIFRDCGTTMDPPAGDNRLDKYIDVDLKVNGETLIPESAHVKLYDLSCHCIQVGNLAPGESMTVELSFHLQCDTPDDYQCDWVMFDIEALLTPDNCPPPECATAIWLENKNDPGWETDDIWGLALYDVSSLYLEVWGFGLDPNTDYQVSINSPEVASWYPVSGGEEQRKEMANALATGVYDSSLGTAPPLGYNLYERGYYDISDGGSVLHADPPGGWQDDTIATFTTSKDGSTPRTYTSDNTGTLRASVLYLLPSGGYEYIKPVIKEDTSPYTPVLMEETTPLFFTIP